MSCSSRTASRRSSRHPCATRPHRGPYNLRNGGAMTHVLSFAEAEQALTEARCIRAWRTHRKLRSSPKSSASSGTTYTDEIAELFQELFSYDHARSSWLLGAIYSPSSFPHPHSHGVGDVSATSCGVCYACQTMDGECVDEQPVGTYLDWHSSQVKEAIKRWTKR